jgi:hypothetical protein
MPPACRNHRTPTAGDTLASTAASSLARPAAIAAQNRRRSSRRATEGRPGDDNTPRPDRSERRLRVFIATSSVEVLRRPRESAQCSAPSSVHFRNALLIRSGAAWVYCRYSDDPALKRAERMARAERRGLWASPNPVPLWERR